MEAGASFRFDQIKGDRFNMRRVNDTDTTCGRRISGRPANRSGQKETSFSFKHRTGKKTPGNIFEVSRRLLNAAYQKTSVNLYSVERCFFLFIQ